MQLYTTQGNLSSSFLPFVVIFFLTKVSQNDRIDSEVRIMTFLEKLDALKARTGDNNASLARNSGVPYTTIDGLYKKDIQT